MFCCTSVFSLSFPKERYRAAFSTSGHAQADAFRWIQGEALLTGYQSSESNVRNFCRVCGSNMPGIFPEMKYVRIPLATLDDDPEIKPKAHSKEQAMYIISSDSKLLQTIYYPLRGKLDVDQ